MISINGHIRIYNEFFYVSHNHGKNTIIFSFTCSPIQSTNYSDCKLIILPILGKITSISSFHIHNINAISEIFEKFRDIDVNSNLKIYKDNLSIDKYLEWTICSSPDKIQQKAIEMWSDEAVFPNTQAVEWLNYVNRSNNTYSFLIIKVPFTDQIISFPPLEINYEPYPMVFLDPSDQIDDDIAYDADHKYHYIPLFNNEKSDGIHKGIPNFNDYSDHKIFISVGTDINDPNSELSYKYIDRYDFEKIYINDAPSSIKEYAFLIKILNERVNNDIIVPCITLYQMSSFSLKYLDQLSDYGYDVPDMIIHNYITTNLTWLQRNISEEGFIKIPFNLSNGKLFKQKQ